MIPTYERILEIETACNELIRSDAVTDNGKEFARIKMKEIRELRQKLNYE